jgi:hypothetical protein
VSMMVQKSTLNKLIKASPFGMFWPVLPINLCGQAWNFLVMILQNLV